MVFVDADLHDIIMSLAHKTRSPRTGSYECIHLQNGWAPAFSAGVWFRSYSGHRDIRSLR